jgi:hypothetical protein
VVDAIGRHHEADHGASHLVLDAVVIANLVAKTIQVGLGAEGLNLSLDLASLRRLDVDFQVFGLMCLQTHTWLAELAG